MSDAPRRLNLDRDGAQLLVQAGAPALAAVEDAIAGLPRDVPGLRLTGVDALRPLLASDGSIGQFVADRLGLAARPVRALLFDKNPAVNWALSWHQDRTICVRARIDTPGFRAWTRKSGLVHVAPPAALLAKMVTLRLHLDDVPPDNGPLLIAPGSHLLGRVAEAELEAVVARCGTWRCTAERGDIWLYATLIVHASEAPLRPARRRVLQVDYAACELPGRLEWLGI
jgi:hypothetical protein